MSSASVIDSRQAQMFPTFNAAEIARLAPFGEVRRYSAGERMVTAGEAAPGMFVILSGEADVTQRDRMDRRSLITTHAKGAFMGELAQLSGRPALVDIDAKTDIEALVIAAPRLRDLLVAEAELGERIMRAMILRRVGLLQTGAGGPVILGSQSDGDVIRLQGFLTRNGHPHLTLDPESDSDANDLIDRFHIDIAELPIVLCPNGELLRNPHENDLARCLGMVGAIDPDKVYDVAIVGAGPAGLAAAVYAASEGLETIVLDCRAFGGQAGASARIENYMGFPTGISGLALMARAYNQAQKFGAEMAIPDEAVRLRAEKSDCGRFILDLANREAVKARGVIVASGARYRRLDVADISRFEKASVHYWASPVEAKLCAGQEVALVGAGNSAGQAAVYLASQVAKVWMIVRGKSLSATMSRYLVERIAAQPNIEVLAETEIVGLEGAGVRLERVRWRNRANGAEGTRAIGHIFLFIGAEPNTDWLAGGGVALDAKGFVRTDLGDATKPLQTTREGVFAIGDVRCGSIKRVAAAVGEGAQVIAALHGYLAQFAPLPP